MKMQKRLIVSLALILGGTSSLALAHDCGESDCAHRHNHSWQDHQRRDDNSDCAQRYNRQDRDYNQSDCAQRYHKSRHTSARWEREASRVLSEIEREVDALTYRQDRYQQVEVDYARPSCRDRDLEWNRQNRRCQKRVVCPSR